MGSKPATDGEPPVSVGTTDGGEPVPPHGGTPEGRPRREDTASVTIQHLLIRYAKRGKMRFASHLDVARAFERGVRRAGLPIAYSTGFTPHPKISYAGGAPTGVASEAEYLSLMLTSRVAADAVREGLNAALPDGIDVIVVTEDSGGLPASRLTASEWQIALPGVPPDNVVPVIHKFLALTEAPVERLTSKGLRRMDARAAVVSLAVCSLPGGRPPVPPDARPMAEDAIVSGAREVPGGQSPVPPDARLMAEDAIVSGAREVPGGRSPVPPDARLMAKGANCIGRAEGGQEEPATGTVLRMVVRHTVPSVRPDDVLNALRDVSDVFPAQQPLMTRLAQGSLDESGVVKL